MRTLFWAGLALPCIDAQVPEAWHLTVDVNLVVLHASVRDSAGRHVSGLRERDVEVYEDGVRQTVRHFGYEDSPLTVGLVVDHSGSIRTKLSDVVTGVRRFAHLSHPRDEMFVVNFNEHVTLPQPDSAPFTNHPDDLERALSAVPATGRTALYDAILAAAGRLQLGRREKRALIVISDGGDNASTHRLAEVFRLAGESSTLIYTIGVFDPVDPDRNPRVLRRLAKASGGVAYFPEGPVEVTDACERVARDIRQHYTIGYVSSNPARDGAFRSVRVVARQAGKKLNTRVRTGYFAGGGR